MVPPGEEDKGSKGSHSQTGLSHGQDLGTEALNGYVVIQNKMNTRCVATYESKDL